MFGRLLQAVAGSPDEGDAAEDAAVSAPPEPSAPTCSECGALAAGGGDCGVSTALMVQPFFDGDGRRHKHDLNRHTTFYRCPNGHDFAVTSDNPCWCGWTLPTSKL